MNEKEVFDFIKQNGVTDNQIMDFLNNPEKCYLINTREIAEKFRNNGFYSDEMDDRLNNIFSEFNITLGQLDLLFHNYEEDLKTYLSTGKMDQDVLMLLKNNFYSENPIARQFVKWINKWADAAKSDLYHLKKQNFLKWITCIDEVEFFRCIHCDNYKKKIESTLKDDEDFEFFKEYKYLFKQQLYSILDFDIDKSLELTEEIRQKRVVFDKKKNADSNRNNGYDVMSLGEVILSRIGDLKSTKNNQLIMLASERHAIYMMNNYPFNITMALIYYNCSDEKNRAIDLSSDNIIHKVIVGYNATNKEYKKYIKELVYEYEDLYSHEKALIAQWKNDKK